MANPLPSVSELAQIGRESLEGSLDPNGTGAVDTSAGSRNDMAISINTALYSRVARYAADRVRAASPFDATGEDLDVLAKDRYGTTRKDATQATGTLYLTRTGTGATSLPKGTRASIPATDSSPAIVWEFADTISVLSGATTAVVPIIAEQPGALGNIAQADISSLLDALPDSTWVINTSFPTPAPLGRGTDKETDQELQKRLAARGINDDRQPGPYASVLAGALSVPGVAFATLIEPGDGTLVLFAGDSGFILTSTLRDAIQTELLNWRAFGVPVFIRSYNLITVQVTANIYMRRPLVNYDTSQIKSNAVAAVKRYFADETDHDEYYVSAIEAALFKAQDGEVQTVVMSSPSSDVLRQPDASYSGVTTLNRYTVTDSSIALTVLDPLVS